MKAAKAWDPLLRIFQWYNGKKTMPVPVVFSDLTAETR